LRDDPARIRKPLQLSQAQVRALISAGAFSTARPAKTTSQSENSVDNLAELMQFGTLGTLGTLLPPEGSGAFPAPGDLPPAPVAPTATVPSHQAPSANVTPPATAPPSRAAPQSHVPLPTSPRGGRPVLAGPTASGAPVVSVTPSASGSPGAAPRQTPAAAPSASTMGSGSPAKGVGSTVVTVAPISTNGVTDESSGNQQQSVGPGLVGRVVAVRGPRATTSRSCCSCDTGMVAIAAQVSATAQSTITALTAIAGLE
jgi:hypothetical protein